MLEQAQLPFVFRLLFNHVHVPVDRALADSGFKRKLVNRLVEVVAHIAAHCCWVHPGWACYMVARELLPDTFGNVEPEGVCHPLQVVIRKVVDCQGIPEAHSVLQI